MRHTSSNTEEHNPVTANRPAHATGRLFVLCGGLLFISMIICMFFGFRTVLPKLKANIDHAQDSRVLIWAERHTWCQQAMPVGPSELEYSMLVQAETGKEFRSRQFSLHEDPEQAALIENMLRTCATCALQPDAFVSDETFGILQQAHTNYPDHFYPMYLIARWHESNGNADRADEWFTQAFAYANTVLIWANEKPSTPLPAIAIALDRINEGQTDIEQSLALVYPAQQADNDGNIYLPVPEAAYRLVDPAKAGKHQGGKQWFATGGHYIGLLNGPSAAGMQLQLPHHPRQGAAGASKN